MGVGTTATGLERVGVGTTATELERVGVGTRTAVATTEVPGIVTECEVAVILQNVVKVCLHLNGSHFHDTLIECRPADCLLGCYALLIVPKQPKEVIATLLVNQSGYL